MKIIHNAVVIKLNRAIEGIRETRESPLYAFDLEVYNTRIQSNLLVVTDGNKNIVFMARLSDIEYVHTELMPD